MVNNDKEKRDIHLAITIILYLLLAIAFFSFEDLENAGVKTLIVELFILSVFSLSILFLSYLNIIKINLKYIFIISCAPFVIYFILIFIRSLYFYLFERGMEEGFNFFHSFAELITKKIFSSKTVWFTLDITLVILLFCLLHQLRKIKLKRRNRV